MHPSLAQCLPWKCEPGELSRTNFICHHERFRFWAAKSLIDEGQTDYVIQKGQHFSMKGSCNKVEVQKDLSETVRLFVLFGKLLNHRPFQGLQWNHWEENSADPSVRGFHSTSQEGFESIIIFTFLVCACLWTHSFHAYPISQVSSVSEPLLINDCSIWGYTVQCIGDYHNPFLEIL